MTPRADRHVYGPVPSRRLGRSLGIDLVPYKTCSYDCIYCQLGRTTHKTTDRRAYVPVSGVLDELAEALRLEPAPDFIGLAGSGEPTLHAGIGEIIDGIKSMTSVPVAVLTNGSLLWVPEVREALAGADLVLPSLDAGTTQGFERVNRPHPDISFERMVDGLMAFGRGFSGRIWLEVFVLAGLTDGPHEMGSIASLATDLRPERIQLNTVSRPSAEASASAVPLERLEELRCLFGGSCEVVAEGGAVRPPSMGSKTQADAQDRIVALLCRRPCTVEGIATGLGLPPNEVIKHLDVLCRRDVVRPDHKEEAVFYKGVSVP